MRAGGLRVTDPRSEKTPGTPFPFFLSSPTFNRTPVKRKAITRIDRRGVEIHRWTHIQAMSDRENFGAGIYAGIIGFVFLVCLVGAFVLPPSVVESKWLGVPALAGFFVGVPLLLRLAHRSRIRDAVERVGGAVVRIKKLPFWDQPYSRYSFFPGIRYRVDYVDTMGATHRALCNSGFFQGVEWLEDSVVIEGPR